MEMRVSCPRCGKALKADSKYAGKKATCPGCKQPFVLQAPSEEAAPEAMPEAPAGYGLKEEPSHLPKEKAPGWNACRRCRRPR